MRVKTFFRSFGRMWLSGPELYRKPKARVWKYFSEYGSMLHLYLWDRKRKGSLLGGKYGNDSIWQENALYWRSTVWNFAHFMFRWSLKTNLAKPYCQNEQILKTLRIACWRFKTKILEIWLLKRQSYIFKISPGELVPGSFWCSMVSSQ